MGNGDQNKKYRIIYDKTQNSKIKVIENFLYDEIENEVLQIFLCDRMANIKVKANINKNQEKRITIEAKVF